MASLGASVMNSDQIKLKLKLEKNRQLVADNHVEFATPIHNWRKP